MSVRIQSKLKVFNMKKIATTLLLGAAVFGIIYLFGCFAQASFNIMEWDPIFRGFTAFFGCSLTLIAMGAYASEN